MNGFRRILVRMTVEEDRHLQKLCRTNNLSKSDFFRGLLNRALRTPKFRPDRVFRASRVKLTPEERKMLERKYGVKIYRSGVRKDG